MDQTAQYSSGVGWIPDPRVKETEPTQTGTSRTQCGFPSAGGQIRHCEHPGPILDGFLTSICIPGTKWEKLDRI